MALWLPIVFSLHITSSLGKKIRKQFNVNFVGLVLSINLSFLSMCFFALLADSCVAVCLYACMFRVNNIFFIFFPQDRTGQDRTGQDSTGQDRTRQDRTGQDRLG